MNRLFGLDFIKLFLPNTSLSEIFIRGTLSYLVIFGLLRFLLKRQSGTINLNDLLILVLVADAVQNGMAGNYRSITEGLFLVTIIISWSVLLDWLGYKFRFFERIIHPPPLLLVKDGKMLHRNMQRELITREELDTQLREQGVADINEVKEAYVEADGRISVITREKESGDKATKNSRSLG